MSILVRRITMALVAASLTIIGASSSIAVAAEFSFTASPAITSGGKYVLSNGSDSWTMTMTVVDELNQPVQFPDTSQVKFTPSSTNVSVSAVSNPSTGVYTALLTSTTPGTYTVESGYASNPTYTSTIRFYVSGPNPAKSTLSFDQDSYDLDCGASLPIAFTALVVDDADNPMVGIPVTFDGEDWKDPVTATTNALGKATATLTVIGSAFLRTLTVAAFVTVGGDPVPIAASPYEITINPTGPCGIPSPTKSTLTPVTQTITKSCDATPAEADVVATILDSSGDPLSGHKVNFTIGSQVRSSTTGSDGMITLTIPSGALVYTNTVEVHAKLDGASEELVNSPVTILFKLADGCTPSVGKTSLSYGPSKQVLGYPITVTLTLEDGNLEKIPTFDTSLIVITPSSSNVQVSTVTNNGDGTYSANLTASQVGAYTMDIVIDGETKASNQAIEFFHRSTLFADRTQLCVGEESLLTATLIQSNGDRAPDTDAYFTVTGSAIVDPDEATSNAQGVLTTTLTNTVAETVVVSLYQTGYTDKLSPDLSVTFISCDSAPDPAQSSVSVSAAIAEAGTEVDVTVMVKDTEGATMSGVVVDLSVSGSGDAYLSDSSCTTGADGTCTVTVNADDTATAIISAKIGSQDISGSGTVSVVFNLAPPPPAYTVTWEIAPKSGSVVYASYWDGWEVTITVKDVSGHPFTDFITRDVHDVFSFVDVSSGAAAGQLATPIRNNEDGTYTSFIMSSAAKSFEVRAALTIDGDTYNLGPETVTFTAPIMDEPGARLYVDSFQQAAPLPEVKAVVVVHDENGQPLQGVKVDFSVSPDAQYSAHQCYSNAEGRCSIRIGLHMDETYEVSATI
ncbi:MAG: hypothetical protein FWD55_01930, partial [Propionibacteriaceae bacterium]|nr:hypothetical protein [Propionibacteriaceae bacterium]